VDLFDQAGIKVSDIKTVSDLITVGKAFHAKFPNSYIWNMGPTPAGYNGWEIMGAYPDPRFATEDGKYVVTTNQCFADNFKFHKDIFDAKIALPIDDWSTDWQKGFTDSAICGSFIATWMKFFLPKFVPEQKGKWKVDLWPVLQPLADQRYGSDAGGSVYVIFKKCPNPTLAVDYNNKMWLTKAGALAVYKAVGNTPAVKSARDDFLSMAKNPQRPEGMSDDVWAVQPANFFGPDYFELELKSYDYLKVFNFDPSATKEKPILDQWLNKVLTGAASISEALANAQKDMESQIGNPYKV